MIFTYIKSNGVDINDEISEAKYLEFDGKTLKASGFTWDETREVERIYYDIVFEIETW